MALSSRKFWTTEKVAELVNLRNQGYSLQEIGNLNNITRERVRQIIGNTGRIPSRNRLTVLHLVKEGYAVPTIAKQVGITTQSVNRIIRLYMP